MDLPFPTISLQTSPLDRVQTHKVVHLQIWEHAIYPFLVILWAIATLRVQFVEDRSVWEKQLWQIKYERNTQSIHLTLY